MSYATAIREDGRNNGTPIGTLGVYFDWKTQGASIVDTEASLPEDGKRIMTVMLLNSEHRVIASTDPTLMFTSFPIRSHGLHRGWYLTEDGVIAFARTQGYQEYDGLGWYGVIFKRS